MGALAVRSFLVVVLALFLTALTATLAFASPQQFGEKLGHLLRRKTSYHRTSRARDR